MPDQFHYALFQAPLDFRPGEKWDYNNTGLALFSPFFQAATGQPLDHFVAAKIFKPIGIRPADWTWDYNGERPLPFSGLHITARALARFGLLVIRGGRWKDKQIVAADWLARAARPSQQLKKEYGYLWWNNSQGMWRGVPKDAFAAIGKFENDMLIVPSLDFCSSCGKSATRPATSTRSRPITCSGWRSRPATTAGKNPRPSRPKIRPMIRSRPRQPPIRVGRRR